MHTQSVSLQTIADYLAYFGSALYCSELSPSLQETVLDLCFEWCEKNNHQFIQYDFATKRCFYRVEQEN